MSVFSAGELAYLHGQRLGRLATVGPDGQPHVVPVGFRYNAEQDSIDIGNFATDMHGWPDEPGGAGFFDLPGNYHNRAGGLSFADGHSEIRRWVDDRTMPPLVPGGLIPDIISSPNNRDILWLQERCTRKINP